MNLEVNRFDLGIWSLGANCKRSKTWILKLENINKDYRVDSNECDVVSIYQISLS